MFSEYELNGLQFSKGLMNSDKLLTGNICSLRKQFLVIIDSNDSFFKDNPNLGHGIFLVDARL